MVCAYRFVNMSGQTGPAVWHMLSRASGLGPTSKGLPEATIGCEALLCGHSGRQAAGFVTIELPSIGKAQSLYGSCHATFPACSA